MSKTVKLSVDEQALVQNLRFAFTNKHTVIGELIQNARRAGATRVDIGYVPDDAEDGKTPTKGTLVVSDNGSGITDFQNLFTVARSGWDEDIKAAERPFGMGWFSALFAAETATVVSDDKKVSFRTADVLAFEEIAVQRAEEPVAGTKVTLTGFPMGICLVARAVANYARGYSINVTFNGEVQERPHDKAALSGFDTEVGFVHVRGLSEGNHHGRVTAYLLGIQVYRSSDYEFGNIVHLDPTQFSARMPDRDKLIDEHEAMRRVFAVIDGLWKEHFLREKAVMAPGDFAEKYWKAAEASGMSDLMNDVPVIPKGVIKKLTALPHRRQYHEYDMEAGPVTREQVEKGEVIVCEGIDPWDDDERNVGNMVAFVNGWLVIRGFLPQGHWLNEHIIHLDDEGFGYRVNGRGREKVYRGHVEANVILCESLTLTWPGGEVTVNHLPLVLGENWDNAEIFVPTEASPSDALHILTDYTDEHESYQEDWYSDDRRDIWNLVAMLKGEAPEVTLVKCLRNGNVADFENVVGQAFLVKVGKAKSRWEHTPIDVTAHNPVSMKDQAAGVLRYLKNQVKKGKVSIDPEALTSMEAGIRRALATAKSGRKHSA